MSDKDTIYRQAAIDAISCDITITGRQNAELVAATIGAFADRIKALPSAQPINKGLWVKQELAPQTLRFCSLCGCKKPQGVAGNFCPNCGASMVQGEEG